ncbi:hypothetical protein QBC35DRAFT_82929 [Podospora australis]|uniref:Uncharacterized protein n=1 Tax=Podospora australis TaxID=1536484 RepID=A0AAN6WKL9_9PEZI|nr:hypothetical protein QBC35DRAFT_82929 [Podospora australis]
MLDCEERVRKLEPHSEHHKMLKLWLARERQNAIEGKQSVLDDRTTKELLELRAEDRPDAMRALHERLENTPFGVFSRAADRVTRNIEGLVTGQVKAIKQCGETRRPSSMVQVHVYSCVVGILPSSPGALSALSQH